MDETRTFNLTRFNEYLVIHFGVDNHEINAETLSFSLIGISNSLRIVDASLNTGYSLELIIEATGDGSFKVITKAVRKSLKNLFSKQNINGLAMGLLTSAIWYWMVPSEEVKIIVKTNEYIIEKGNERIILPRAAEAYFDSIKRNDSLKQEVAKTFKVINADDRVANIGFHSDDTRVVPDFFVDRKSFHILATLVDDEKLLDDFEVDVSLTIIKAILKKSLRKWEFDWEGKEISAPIFDFDFYKDFDAHKITIAPGDTLEVRLRVITERNPDTRIVAEKSYEVIKVHRHVSISEAKHRR